MELRGRGCVRRGHRGRDLGVVVRVQHSLSGGGVRACAAGYATVVSRVGVEHLQQQVVQQDDILPLHAGKVLHAFVTADRRRRRERWIIGNTLTS